VLLAVVFSRQPKQRKEDPMNEKRNKFEKWLNKHNHLMELIRTLIGVAVLVLQIYILIKITAI